jgi:hypothetical protein
MLELHDWNPELDLTEFYSEMGRRGFENNSSQSKMIDCFKNESMYKAWILYKDNYACGSVISHSLPILGSKSYRICARTASFSECFPKRGLLTRKRMIHQLQHVTAQIYIPRQIEYLGHDKDLFISSNDSIVASQRIVHNLWCPEMERIGLLSKECEMEYRGHVQSFWRLNVGRYLTELAKYPRWV